jgi:hypothetical protein
VGPALAGSGTVVGGGSGGSLGKGDVCAATVVDWKASAARAHDEWIASHLQAADLFPPAVFARRDAISGPPRTLAWQLAPPRSAHSPEGSSESGFGLFGTLGPCRRARRGANGNDWDARQDTSLERIVNQMR